MSQMITLAPTATTASLLEPQGGTLPVEIRSTGQRVFEDATDAPPAGVVVFDLVGGRGFPLGKAMLEYADGAQAELEIVFAVPLDEDRAYYLGVAQGQPDA